jgi:cysteine desulfuration protein SufE
MKSISEVESEIILEFESFDDWVDKYNYLIDLGRTLPPIDESYRQDKYLIGGCQSQVWLYAIPTQGDKVQFFADSDAIITKGIAALLVRVLSNQPASEVINAPLNFIEQTGLKEHLSQTRSNGLVNMIKQMKLYALALSEKSQI